MVVMRLRSGRYRALTLAVAVCVATAGCGDSGGDTASDEGGSETSESPEGQTEESTGDEGTPSEDAGADEGTDEGASEGDTESTDEGTETSDEGDEGDTESSEGNGEGGNLEPVIDLRADTNRNGKIDLDDPTEDTDEEAWSTSAGAIFLANLDDDEDTCSAFAGNDYELAACFDGNDEVVNGPTDLLDMAPLKVVAWPDAPDSARAKISWAPGASAKVRLFSTTDGTTYTPWSAKTSELTAAQLRAGADLWLEGTQIVMDRAQWDGLVTVELRIYDGDTLLGSDTVQLRVAPMMLYHHNLRGEAVYAAIINWAGDASQEFRDDIRSGLEASLPTTDAEFIEYATTDQWTQDYFEPAFMTMPGPDGQQHTIRLNIRSANVYSPDSKVNPLRPAGKVVYQWRGPDMGAVQIFDITHPGSMDSLDSYGNTEVIPPYTHNGKTYPLGRIYRGSVPNFYPDPLLAKTFESQMMQPPVYVDTSWLLVGHVDETVSFLEQESERGWAILANDPLMAKQMLEDQVAAGNGAVTMFKGKVWYVGNGTEDAEVSIDAVLANTNVMKESLASAAEVLEQVEILKEETGLTEEEITWIPYMHESVQGYSLAYQVGTINSLVLDEKNYFTPKTHGPEIEGVDIFQKQFEDALAARGFNVHWVENWELYHALSGEVHCGSNTMREIPSVKWWETGL
jgi:protein-arginine deiminase